MNYVWGKIGNQSLVYQLLNSSGQNDLQDNQYYSELWMGDHPSAPSLIKRTNQKISEEHELPFLSKILSIQTPLSLQCHPNKSQAEKLYQSYPGTFPDSNEKPEMAVFLSKTSLLYGFRPYNDIISYINNVSEFREICSDSADVFLQEQNSTTLKLLFTSIIKTPHEKVLDSVHRFQRHINENPSLLDESALRAFRIIQQYFPDDVGNFFPLFLNVVEKEKGTALYIPPGTLHAYLAGDLYEIMTVSDNVIRAALTKKFIDIDNLLEIVEFQPQPPIFVQPIQESPSIVCYKGPKNKFIVKIIKLSKNEQVTVPEHRMSSILLNLKGCSNILDENHPEGTVLLVPKMTHFEISSPDGSTLIIGSII